MAPLSVTVSKASLKVACKVRGNLLASSNRLLPSLLNELKVWGIIAKGSFAYRAEIADLNAYAHVLAPLSVTVSKASLKVACKVRGNLLASSNRLLPSLLNELKVWGIIAKGGFA